MQAYIIGLSINQKLKLKKEKDKERQVTLLKVLCNPLVI